MTHTLSSLSVIDSSNGKPLSAFRFSGIRDALEYLTKAKLICSKCGSAFHYGSDRNIISRGRSWEILMRHDCQAVLAREEPAIAIA